MAKSMIDAPKKPANIKPESCLQRRNSTGGTALIFSEPIPIPNYLRASIGSCHDLCKYGSRRDSSAESVCRNRNMIPEAKSKTNNRGDKAPSGTKNPVPRKQPDETSKSTCNAPAISRNDEGKRRSSLPRTTSSIPESSVRIPTSKIRRSKSVPEKVPKSESEKLLESSESCKKSEHCDQTVAEKIIHVVETNDRGNQNEDVDDQKQKMESAANDSSSRKLELKRVEVVEAENREAEDISWKEIKLRRVASEGDSEYKKKECMRIVVMGKNKVKALVDTFETLMSTRDSEGSRTCSNSA